MLDQENISTPTGVSTSVVENTSSSTYAIHIKRERKDKIPLVEIEVRRSCRFQSLNKGLKKIVSVDRNCLAFHAIPRPIPRKVVKNLNTTFCKVNVQDTSEDKLSTRSKKIKGTTATRANSRNSKGQSKSQN